MNEKTLTIALMDPPYESANTATALRIIASALKKGIRVNVFKAEAMMRSAVAVYHRLGLEEGHPRQRLRLRGRGLPATQRPGPARQPREGDERRGGGSPDDEEVRRR